MVWEEFVTARQGWGELEDMERVNHPACRLLRQYWHRGSRVVLAWKERKEKEWKRQLEYRTHCYTIEYVLLLRYKLDTMVRKRQ